MPGPRPCPTVVVVMLCACAVAAGAGAQTALSPFARAKARALIRDHLPCLGCHALEGEGARLAPDLSQPGMAFSAAFVDSMVRDPEGTRPGTMMPRTPMPRETADLVVSYLVGSRVTPAPRAPPHGDRKSTRLNSSHLVISYAVFCLKKKKLLATPPLFHYYPTQNRSSLRCRPH